MLGATPSNRESNVHDVRLLTGADVAPLRRGAPGAHPLDDTPGAIHLGLLHDGQLIGAVSGYRVRPAGQSRGSWLMLNGPFGEGGQAVVEALADRSDRATLWADSPRPGLDQAAPDRWERRPAPRSVDPSGPGEYTADSITVLEGLEAVRTRPGMYVGSTGPGGIRAMIIEAVNNVLDEHLAGYASNLWIHHEPRRHMDRRR